MVDRSFDPRRGGRYHRTVDYENTDYPFTDFWIPARNFRRPRAPRQIRFVIIHITGGPAMTENSAINRFMNSGASAHYIVNREGSITQMVRDAHIANHIDRLGSTSNRDSIGIEHVNPWNRARQLHPTALQYEASARLVGWLCATYDIPALHNPNRGAAGIRGHMEEQPNTHHSACPNPAWDWSGYIGKVARYKAAGPTFDDLIARLAQGS